MRVIEIIGTPDNLLVAVNCFIAGNCCDSGGDYQRHR